MILNKLPFRSLFLVASLICLYPSRVLAAPTISNPTVITQGSIPQYTKYEASFPITTIATTPHFPYDSSTPPGINPGQGITVNALITSPAGQTYTLPLFYYQDFDYQVKSGREWLYPNGNFSFRFRFSPPSPGTWTYRISAQDSSGTTTSPTYTFVSIAGTNPGFVKVSQNDYRYFEFSNGQYFPALGYNMNYNHISWDNPVLNNQTNFQKMGQNGIQLVRLWLSEWSIFGLDWSQWNTQNTSLWGYNIHWRLGVFDQPTAPGSEVSMFLDTESPCVSYGLESYTPAIKPNTTYRFRVYYRPVGVTGPKVSGKAYGFTAKVGDWLWGSSDTRCDNPDAGYAFTTHDAATSSSFKLMETTFSTSDSRFVRSTNFLQRLHLTLDNATGGQVYVDNVSIQEVYGNNQYGPNLISKPSASAHLYFDQQRSYAFDKVVTLAEQNGVYLRPVILEKNDRIWNFMKPNGTFAPGPDSCWDDPPSGDCPDFNDYFYGTNSTLTKNRWLYHAYWRYLQARWGYSTAIHSWELLNEGDPNSGNHFNLAQDFAAYMKAFSPNAHLVSTSTWGGYNASEWQKCSDCQFTDIHRYINPIDEFAAHFWRPAQATYDLSQSTDFLNKPVIRGEVSFIDTQNTDDASTIITRDTNGVWLHHFLWGGLNPGGLIESYWDEDRHIYYGSTDFRPLYKHYYDFIKDIPLNQGGYVDAVASTSNSALRAWGQKNTAKNLAHLWVFHPSNTWCAAVGGVSGCPTSYVNSPLTGTLTLSGFTPNTTLPITYWQFSKTVGLAQNTTSVTTNASGALTLNLSSLPSTTVDVGIKIGNYSAIPSPSLSPNPLVDYRNFLDLVTQFGQNITIFNFNQLINRLFKS